MARHHGALRPLSPSSPASCALVINSRQPPDAENRSGPRVDSLWVQIDSHLCNHLGSTAPPVRHGLRNTAWLEYVHVASSVDLSISRRLVVAMSSATDRWESRHVADYPFSLELAYPHRFAPGAPARRVIPIGSVSNVPRSVSGVPSDFAILIRSVTLRVWAMIRGLRCLVRWSRRTAYDTR